MSSAGTCGKSTLVKTQQGLGQSKIPPPGEHHGHSNSASKSRCNNYMTFLRFHDSISSLVEHDFPCRSVRAITCTNKPQHLQIAFALPLAFIYTFHMLPRQKSPLLEPVDKTRVNI